MEGKRERPLLVLSPNVRDRHQVSEYKPFGGKSLLGILRDVAAGVSQQKSRRYDEHAVFADFFFGQHSVSDATLEHLRDVPASLVDCATYKSDAPAADVAKKVLSHFASENGKTIVLSCNDECRVAVGFDSKLARSEDALYAYLWMDLCGGSFSRIGEEMARRWGG